VAAITPRGSLRGTARRALDEARVLSQAALAFRRGWQYGKSLAPPDIPPDTPHPRTELETYFDSHVTGRGVWKWQHYFPIYDRHFARFRGQSAHILEIGVYSGGSLDMWREYFGDAAHIYGVDIEPACHVYEAPNTRIFIGDQGDKAFWKSFLEEVPSLDIVIDDGGHMPEQQIATLEALLPHMRPGGVYLCEDIHNRLNTFLSYIDGLSRNLHVMKGEGLVEHEPSGCQRLINSVHLYPYVAVLESRAELLEVLTAPKHGTEWQPFLG
jgi:hypothetical protein